MNTQRLPPGFVASDVEPPTLASRSADISPSTPSATTRSISGVPGSSRIDIPKWQRNLAIGGIAALTTVGGIAAMISHLRNEPGQAEQAAADSVEKLREKVEELEYSVQRRDDEIGTWRDELARSRLSEERLRNENKELRDEKENLKITLEKCEASCTDTTDNSQVTTKGTPKQPQSHTPAPAVKKTKTESGSDIVEDLWK